MSPELTLSVLDRWPTPAVFWKDVSAEMRRIEQTEGQETQNGQRKKQQNAGEKYITEQLCRGKSRDVKGKLAASLWTLYTSMEYPRSDDKDDDY